MAEYTERESFIPYSRRDVVQLCLQDNKLSESESQNFEAFCEILSAYYHFEFHQLLERLKFSFSHLDPDTDKRELQPLDDVEKAHREQSLYDGFKEVLECANFTPLTQEMLQAAFQEESLISLDMSIDFEDFENYLFYWRGAHPETHTDKKWWRTKTLEMEVFDRVVLLIKFKDASYFESQNRDVSQMDFVPGKTYIYLYKNIPKMDLEVLFPNVQIQMTWKDKLMFMVPAVGAGIPMIFKALPQLVLIAGVILFFAFGPLSAQKLGVDQGQVQNILPVLLALTSLGMVFGSFAFKQYINYKNKKLKFLKGVTDTLFFKNLVCNSGVFHSLVDAAEEEECKEIILAYYHLLTHENDLDTSTLDDLIENWFETQHDLALDFDIAKALEKMKRLAYEGKPLLWEDGNALKVQPLDEAKTLIDAVWDNIFSYNS